MRESDAKVAAPANVTCDGITTRVFLLEPLEQHRDLLLDDGGPAIA